MPGTNWWVDSFPASMPGGTTVGGGGSTDVLTARSPLDAKRMADGFAPGASWPDGYLGTITDRREDRLFGAVQGKLTERSYQRGVHKGEKLGTDSYYWTPGCNPEAGIRRESMAQLDIQEGGVVMRVERYAPSGDPVEKLTALGNSASLPPEQQMQVARQFGVDPGRDPLPMTMTQPDRVTRMQDTYMIPSYR